MAAILVILVFVTAVLLVYVMSPGEPVADARLRRYGFGRGSQRGRELSKPFAQRVVLPMLERVGKIGFSFTPGRMRGRAEQRLVMAGYPLGLQVGTYFIWRTFFGVLLAVLALAFAAAVGSMGVLQILMAIVMFIVGGMLADMWLARRVRARQHAIQRALPDSLDLVTVCVEAGLSLDAALARVAEKTEGPLTDEIRLTLQEIALGKPRAEALRDLSARSGSADLRSFLAAVIQADQMGVSIADVLRVQSEALRVRRRQRAEELAMTAPIKMLLFAVVPLILPALFIVVLGPAGVRIIEFFRETNL